MIGELVQTAVVGRLLYCQSKSHGDGQNVNKVCACGQSASSAVRMVIGQLSKKTSQGLSPHPDRRDTGHCPERPLQCTTLQVDIVESLETGEFTPRQSSGPAASDTF